MASNSDDTSTPSDEEMRKVLKPCPSEAQVLEVLQQSYADDADIDSVKIIRQLDSYDDCNYLVEIAATKYLLKVHNGVESKDFLEVYKGAGQDYYKPGHMSSCIHLQNAIMELLTREGIQTSAPIPPKTKSATPNDATDKLPVPLCVHSLPVISEEHSPCDLVVRLLRWVPGRTMADMKLLPMECLADAGRQLGKIDKALDLLHDDCKVLHFHMPTLNRRSSMSRGPGLERGSSSSSLGLEAAKSNDDRLDASLLKAARRFHQWDGKNTAELKKFTHCITDAKRRRLVESVIDAFTKTLIKSGVADNEFRKGVIHGDYNDANVLLGDDFQVTGVIDFGDCVESWRVLDVSVAMAYGMLSTYGKSNRSLSAAAAVLRGYNSVYPLMEACRKHLVLLVACRLACSATLGAYSYQQDPSNKYLLLHSEPCWKALELIWCYDPHQRQQMGIAADRLFSQACLYSDSHEKIMTCYDLVVPDPGIADLLQSVRVSYTVSSLEGVEQPRKKHKGNEDGLSVITFVTGNAKKLEEVKRILGIDSKDSKMPFHLTNMKVDLPELQGDPVTIAKEKCRAAANEVQGAVITEDTSLCFNALNELPGPYIKWFLEKCGLDGLNKMIEAHDDKTGYAQTIVAFCPGPGKEPAIFDGRTSGTIVMPRGKLDFGWDPIFQPNEGGGKTYAEMGKGEKDAISHRSRAFGQLREYLVGAQASIQSEMEQE